MSVAVLTLAASLISSCRHADRDRASGAATTPVVFTTRALAPLDLKDSATRLAARDALVAAYETRDANLTVALDRAIEWLNSPAAERAYDNYLILPPGVSRLPERPQALLRRRVYDTHIALRDLLEESPDADAFADAALERFDLYRAGADLDEHRVTDRPRPATPRPRTIGATGRDANRNFAPVHFTAYYAPEYPASRVPSDRFVHPIYAAPPELRRDPAAEWNTRRDIVERDLLAGYELFYLENELDAYLVQVNGSARLILPSGERVCVGYSATNNREYTSLGRLLVNAHMSTAEEMSMQTIRRLFNEEPTIVKALMLENDRFVFFSERDCESWPGSALGFPLTTGRSIATDRALFPPAALALVDARDWPNPRLARQRRGAALSSASAPNPATIADPLAARATNFTRFVIDHDTGGAIRGHARADLYLGHGEPAGATAGQVNTRGALYYLLLK